MKKISRKLFTSGLSLAFATVALGTTTFAWFTTNAQVTADITVGVQATGDSILISTDCFDWGSSVEIDASALELNPVTYNAVDGELAATDTFTDMDGAPVSGGTTAAANYLEFVLYLKVSSANKAITFDPGAITDQTEILNTTDGGLKNYTILKTTNFNYSASFVKTSTAASTLTAGNKVKVDAVNAVRSVLDVSGAGSAANQSYTELENNQGAVAAAFPEGVSYTRNDTIVGYEGQGEQPTSYTSGQIYNFGNSLAGNNAANSYIETVLGTNFSDSEKADYYSAESNYAEHALSQTWSSTLITKEKSLFTTTEANQIYALRFSYWLEGYDADCFDAVMGQALSIHFGFRALEATE